MISSESDLLEYKVDWFTYGNSIAEQIAENIENQDFYCQGCYTTPVSWETTEGILIEFSVSKGASYSYNVTACFIKQGRIYQVGFESYDIYDNYVECMEILRTLQHK